jgi:hypothetical protein
MLRLGVPVSAVVLVAAPELPQAWLHDQLIEVNFVRE